MHEKSSPTSLAIKLRLPVPVESQQSTSSARYRKREKANMPGCWSNTLKNWSSYWSRCK